VKTLLGLNTEELCALVQELGEPAYRGKQLAEWIYQHGVRTFEEMNNLPSNLRMKLNKHYAVGCSDTIAIQRSCDGTIKLLLGLKPKTKIKKPKTQTKYKKLGDTVETVGIPYADRFSCCLSTQVGCPVGCVFCATGMGGFTRNLTAGEIVDQVLAVQEAAGNRRIDHAVFMGMGEPLLNYEATVKAVRLLNEEMGIAMRHLTVSTVGFVPGIRRLAQEKLQVTLAVSLHAATDKLRRRLIPGMKFSLAEIIAACKEYLKQTGRRVTFEYCLLDGVNDSLSEAQVLARLLQGMNCHVNLIPYNPVTGLDFCTKSRRSVKAFREVLENVGIQVTQRVQRGADISAACGQLKNRYK
jgi:23S rRNA (adenine2503-C2)-methyltransferase